MEDRLEADYVPMVLLRYNPRLFRTPAASSPSSPRQPHPHPVPENARTVEDICWKVMHLYEIVVQAYDPHRPPPVVLTLAFHHVDPNCGALGDTVPGEEHLVIIFRFRLVVPGNL